MNRIEKFSEKEEKKIGIKGKKDRIKKYKKPVIFEKNRKF